MTVFTAAFSAIAVSAAQDCFQLLAHTSSKAIIHEIRLGQYTDFGDAAAEIISVQLVRGDTVGGSGGAAVTPRPVLGYGNATAVTVVERNNTTVANTGGVVLLADTFNIAAGWWWEASSLEKKHMRFGVGISQRFCVRITAPADSLTMNGTIIFEETGF